MKHILYYLLTFLIGVVLGALLASKPKPIGYYPVKNYVFYTAILKL